jgi:hypothetical protein
MPFKPLTLLVLAWLTGLPLLSLPLKGLAAEQMPVDLELLLAVDISGSIDADEARLQREGYARALIDKDVIKAIRGGIHGKIAIAYFDWSDAYVQNPIMDWTLVQDEASARRVAQHLLDTQTRTARRTSITGAINYAIPRFGAGAYKGLRRVLDVSGDGPNNDGGPIDLARDKAVSSGIVINGLVILNGKQNTWGFPQLEDLDRYYEGCVIGGPGSFVVVAEGFDTFHEAVRRKLILEIATAPAVPPAWQRIGPPVFHKAQSGYRYPKGCDVGERQSQEFWRRRWDQ